MKRRNQRLDVLWESLKDDQIDTISKTNRELCGENLVNRRPQALI